MMIMQNVCSEVLRLRICQAYNLVVIIDDSAQLTLHSQSRWGLEGSRKCTQTKFHKQTSKLDGGISRQPQDPIAVDWRKKSIGTDRSRTEERLSVHQGC